MLVLLLALPALRADDKPKEDPKAQYDALGKEFTKQQREIIAQFSKTKGEEQQKLFMKYTNLGTDFAEKFYKLAENNPKDPIATDALFWVVQFAQNSPQYKKAADKVTALVPEMPLKDLAQRITGLRGNGPPALLEAAYQQAEKDTKNQEAGDLLAALAVNRSNPPVSKKATELLIDKFPDHKGIAQVCTALSYIRGPEAVETLKVIFEKSSAKEVKAAAALALAKGLAAQVDQLSDKQSEADKKAAEAEKYLTIVIDQFAKDNPAQLKEAKRNLKALQTLRVGKDAPNITAPDLDEKEFKLSDYRGKVVLLDFWGNW
jgi:hypothetical protein